MGELTHATPSTPPDPLADLRPEQSDDWFRRTYTAATLHGLFHTWARLADRCRMRTGRAHLDDTTRAAMSWWPEGDGRDAIWRDGSWTLATPEDVGNDTIGPVNWIGWEGESGAAVLVARRAPALGPAPLRTVELWSVDLCLDPVTARQALAVLGNLEPTDAGEDSAAAFDGDPESCPANAELRASIALADHYDPRSRTEIIERTWVEMVNTVQYEVAWHLHSDRLLPAIGRAMQHCLGYDYIDIHVFNRLGSRYEEFLSWQDNRTGFGNELNIFIDKGVIKKVLEAGNPRLIRMSKEDGVLNPHLAELAGMCEGLLVPLVHEHKVQGVMALYYARPTRLGDNDLHRIARLGHVIARSIENSNAHEDMRLMASVDALTGLANRRSFNDVIEKETHRSSRYRLPLSLILIDIDFFKTYNDTNGHLKGDYLLRDFSAILQKMVREEDTVARYGGEEFAIVLPHTVSENAFSVAEKIRIQVAETSFQNMESQPDKRITISLGVTDTDGSIEDFRELIDQADKALYRAKDEGRNRTVLYTAELASQRA